MAKKPAGGHALPPRVAEAVRTVVAPSVEAANLFLEDVKLTSAGSRAVVRVVLDLPEDELGSLGSERLDQAAAAISKALDEDDVVPGAYVLEVSTPGAGRPLTTLRHFKRARGRIVEVNRKSGAPVRGRLMDVVQKPADAKSVECPAGVDRDHDDADSPQRHPAAPPGDRRIVQPESGGSPLSGATDHLLLFDNGTQVPLSDVTKGKVKVELKQAENLPITDFAPIAGADDDDDDNTVSGG